MRPLHESVVKEKSEEISLIGAGNEANNQLLASFPTKSSGVSTILLVIRLVQRSPYIHLMQRSLKKLKSYSMTYYA